ncbi:hypothetical protein LX32DRAFT_252288 [Colletotrichum zoysiae]|uniref:Uncharacterized protein n=1 Tax=Colletotrichum zoysiae TaxID=1216348 RepID=A0AAD9HTW5_9PEZI|nr:hypothetical protein LX32DRAFT_252288 [Colletotrichum zoysiae]
MKLFYFLVIPAITACAAAQTTSNQKNTHNSKIRQSFNQADYGNIISRATDDIPETDDDIEPMIEVEGKLIPLRYEDDVAFFNDIKKRYPNLLDGWYYGILCYYAPIKEEEPPLTPESEKVVQWVIDETGCTHTALLVGKYNTTRKTFSGWFNDVILALNKDHEEVWKSRNHIFDSTPHGQRQAS